MSEKKQAQTPREIIEKLAAMTPKEFNGFMYEHFNRLCSQPAATAKES
jgi:hypothetical protein